VSAVRPLVAADEGAWRGLWAGYLAFYEASLPAEATETTWRRLLDPAEPVHGFCALDAAGAAVGFAHYLFHRATWSVADRCYLADLFVAPHARGGGFGRALIEAVYGAADRAGADIVYWLTAETNASARRLYDRVGKLTPFIEYRR
jgi:GNAT superfamily N-acetyltransferase